MAKEDAAMGHLGLVLEPAPFLQTLNAVRGRPRSRLCQPFFLLGVLMAAAWTRELALLRSVATVLLLL